MSLAKRVFSTPQREKSGPDTDRRYQYQALWGLTMLLKRHGEGSDYTVVFEFHDDIALFDSPKEPKFVRFYQIKTKATPGGWTIQKLIERKASPSKGVAERKPSFIDKMFDNIHNFHPSVLSAEFVSNRICSFYSKKEKFRFSECNSDDFEKIVSALQNRYPSASSPQIELLGFWHSDLSLPDATAHLKGKLHEFIIENLGSIKFNLQVIYTSILEECRRKSTFVGECDSFDQIVRNKGISRDDVNSWLGIISEENRAPDWAVISSSLVECDFSRKIAIGRQYSIYRSAVLDVGNVAIIRVRRKIQQELESVGDYSFKTLDVVVDFLCSKCENLAKLYITPFSLDKLRAMIIYEIYASS